jgi:autoinducer 2-degrading protein
MFVTLVHLHVKSESVESFIEATTKNHHASVREPGNLRFDVLRHLENPSFFTLYEAYENEASAKAHKETPHYLEWRETVAGMMARPREGIKYEGLLP